MREKYPKLVFNRTRMYMGRPFEIDLPEVIGKVTVYEPKMGDIVDFGDDRFMDTLNIFITNTTSNRLFLWNAGLDWNEISDFQLFCILYKNIDPDAGKLLFGELDWTTFEPVVQTLEDGTNVMHLVSEKENIDINEDVYQNFHQYLQLKFNMFPEEKFTDDSILKQWYINKDQREVDRNAKLDRKSDFSLQPLISSLVNHPGFKYKLHELNEVGVSEFYDSVQRLQIYENTTALLRGSYSGMCDMSKVPKDQFNFMRDFTEASK